MHIRTEGVNTQMQVHSPPMTYPSEANTARTEICKKKTFSEINQQVSSQIEKKFSGKIRSRTPNIGSITSRDFEKVPQPAKSHSTGREMNFITSNLRVRNRHTNELSKHTQNQNVVRPSQVQNP